MAKITVNTLTKQASVDYLTDMITQRWNYYSIWENGYSRNGRLAYYAHESNFEGEKSIQKYDEFMEPVFLDFETGQVTRCPVPPSPFEKNLLPQIRALNPIFIDSIGRIFYSVWYAPEYGNLNRPTIIRYDPSSNEYTHTKGGTKFVLEQPEIGDDTEEGSFSESFAISEDGRYVYCIISGNGTDGGSYHTDYSFLVEYDFETHQITRLDGGVRGGGEIIGINRDFSKIIYSLGSRKYYDLKSRQAYEIENVYISYKPQCSYSINSLIDAESIGLYLYDFVLGTEKCIVDTRCYTPQFDSKGNIFFVLEGEIENYLCKMTDITMHNTYDTIAILPSNVKHLLLIE